MIGGVTMAQTLTYTRCGDYFIPAWVQHVNSLKAQAEEIVNAELILSFPIRNVTGMIRCNITNVEAVLCLYCRKFFHYFI